MWIHAPDNVDFSKIFRDLRGNTALNQTARSAGNIAQLSSVQNVALAKRKQQEGGRRPSRGQLKQKVPVCRPNSVDTEL